MMRVSRYKCVAIAALSFACAACPAPKENDAARVANAVASAAGANAMAHALLTPAVENPSTALTSTLYHCIGDGAAGYWPGMAFAIEAPPALAALRAGADSGWERATGNLRTGGAPIAEAPAGRLVCLNGDQFSALKEHNLVMFGNVPGPRSTRSSKSALCTAVPLLDVTAPVKVDVRAIVRGVPSNTAPLTVVPAPRPSAAPFILAKRVLAKQYQFAAALQATDWTQLLRASGDAADPHEADDALRSAARMLACAKDLEHELRNFETEINRNARLLELHEIVLHNSPEIEQRLDAALDVLRSGAAPRGRTEIKNARLETR